MAESSVITLRDVSKSFNGVDVLRDISFTAGKNEIIAVTGPSGTGKTTLLRLIAGTLQPDSGSIQVDSERLGFVFQDHRLLPWRTARDNIALVLQARGDSITEARDRANMWLERVGLLSFGDHYPSQLSGGMVQRVSIARAFAIDPEIVLMDEPFGSLDAELTDSLLLLLQKVLADSRAATFYVTHDIMEALRLADRLFTLGPEGLRERRIEDRHAMLREYNDSRLNAIEPLSLTN